MCVVSDIVLVVVTLITIGWKVAVYPAVYRVRGRAARRRFLSSSAD